MKSRICDIDYLDGKAAALGGDLTPFTEVDDMKPSGINAMVDSLNKANNEVLGVAPHSLMDKIPDWLNPVKGASSVGEAFGDIYNKNRFWSAKLSDEYIQPLQDYLEDFFAEFGDDLSQGASTYYKEIPEVLDSLDDSLLSPEQMHHAERYKKIFADGGSFYAKENGLELVNNVVSNYIGSSPTVLYGNLLEVSYKLPALYPDTMIPAIKKAIDEVGGIKNLGKRIPEIEAKGGYGSSIGTNVVGNRKAYEGIIGLTDIPAKNIVYYAGELREAGGGMKALQDVMFVPRFADVPEIYMSSGGRVTVGLLSYTINTYKLINGLALKAAKRDMFALKALGTMALISGGIGGLGSESGNPVTSTIASATPDLVRWPIQQLIPESEEWFDENTGTLSPLMRAGGIDRIGVPFEMVSRQAKRAFSKAGDSLEEFGDGGLWNGTVDMVDALFTLAPFGRGTIFNDAQFQKVKDLAVEAFKWDLDFDEVGEKTEEVFVPYALRN